MRKTLKQCKVVSCNTLTRETYCDKHKSLAQDEKKSAYQFYDMYKRNQASKAFYNSSSWKKIRDRKKHESSNLCKHCMDRGVITAADVCDHILPIEIRWDLRLTYSNLQMLCHGCHNRKTREDEKKYGTK